MIFDYLKEKGKKEEEETVDIAVSHEIFHDVIPEMN